MVLTASLCDALDINKVELIIALPIIKTAIVASFLALKQK
jgi:hypothetical protein